MAEMFDPNAQAYQGQVLAAVQQRKMAEALRQRAAQMEAPQGQMIGTGIGARFVAPHWLQQLNPAVGQGMASYYGGKADKAELAAQEAKLAEEQRALEAQNADAEQWRAGMPQAVAAQPEMAPPDELGGGPPTAAVAAQPVTTDQILKHTLAGLRNPMLKEEAGVYNRAALGEVDREDRQRQALQVAREAITAKQQAEQERRQWQEEQNALYKRTADQQNSMLRATLAARGSGGGGGSDGIGGAATHIGSDAAGNPIYRHTKSGRLFQYGPDGRALGYEGAVGPKALKATEAERSSAGYLGRMEAVEGKIKDAPALSFFQQTMANRAPSLAPYTMDTKQQSTRAMQEDWVRAKLRKESGAAIPTEEMDREIRTYFPMPGEGEGVAKVKAQARAQAREQLRTSAGSVKPTIAADVAEGSWEAPPPAAAPKGGVVKWSDLK